MDNPFDEDFFQWAALVILLCVSFTTAFMAISNNKLSKDVHQMKGKVDLISDTYTDIFKGMHQRLMAAMEKEDD